MEKPTAKHLNFKTVATVLVPAGPREQTGLFDSRYVNNPSSSLVFNLSCV